MDLRSCLVITIGVIGLCSCGFLINLDKKTYLNLKKKLLFQLFTKKCHKHYEANPDGYKFRYQKFQESMKRVDALNSNRKLESSAIYGLTQFSDLSPKEFSSRKLQKSLSKRVRKHPDHPVSPISIGNTAIITITSLRELLEGASYRIKLTGEHNADYFIEELQLPQFIYKITTVKPFKP